MKLLKPLTITICLFSLNSCGLIGSLTNTLLRVPTRVLSTAGGISGLTLTDEVASPITETEALDNEDIKASE